LKGRPELLIHIHRKRPTPVVALPSTAATSISSANSAIEVRHHSLSTSFLPQIGLFGGLKDEVSNLKRDRNVLMLELVRLRQQQQVRHLSILYREYLGSVGREGD